MQVVVGVPWFWQYVSRLCTAAVQSLQLAHVYRFPFDSLYWIVSHSPPGLLVVHSSYDMPLAPQGTDEVHDWVPTPPSPPDVVAQYVASCCAAPVQLVQPAQ